MSIEGFESCGFEGMGEYWEPISGWDDYALSDKTNEVVSGDLEEGVGKVFQGKGPKKQSVAYLHKHDPRMRCISVKIDEQSEGDLNLSQRQIDFLTFQLDEDKEAERFWSFYQDRQNSEEGIYFGESPFFAATSEYRDEGFVLAPPYGNSLVMQCGFRKSFKKACHKAGKTWRKHKVEIIIGTVVVTAIIITVVVVTSTGGTAGGAIIAGGGAVLDRLINGEDDRPPPDFSFDSNASPTQELSEPPKLQSIEEKWDDIKNSPYFINQGIAPQSPPTPAFSMKPPPPDLIRPWAPQAPNTMFVDKPKEPTPPLPPKQPPSPAYPPLNPNQPMTYREWYREYLDKEENGVLYYPDEVLMAPADITKTPKLDQFIKDKKVESPYDVNILCQDEMAYAVKAWHERNQVVPALTSQRLPTLGEPNKDLLILGINGMNTDLNEALGHQAYLKSFVPENVGVDFIHNHSNSALIDLLEIFGLNYFGFSPKTSNLIKETWTEFHEHHKDNPAKKILHICHSQGAIHTYNALINCPKEIRDRLIIISIAPAKNIPKGACYRSIRYASKNDFVHFGELLNPSFFDPNETGMSRRSEMIQEIREGLILLNPHLDAEKLDHGLQSLTFKLELKDPIEDYVSKNGEYIE